MHTRILRTGLLVLALAGCTKDNEKKAPEAKPATQEAASTAPQAASTAPKAAGFQALAEQGKPLYAKLETNQGTLVVQLFSKDAPKTVANFVGLAAGEKEWRDPYTGKQTSRPLYDGTTFHRIIPGFMIQGGDPLGNGTGDPGYRFGDEFQSGRTFEKAGLLAMANAGPNTNGSQFFITLAPTPWLNNRHTIFGEVVKGQDVVERIAKVQRDPRDKPLQPVVLEKVSISEQQP